MVSITSILSTFVTGKINEGELSPQLLASKILWLLIQKNILFQDDLKNSM